MFKNKKIIILSVTFILISGIMSGYNKSIVDPDVSEVVTEDKNTGIKCSITNKDSLEKIVKKVNSCQKEFRIFKAQKEMTLKYKNGKKTTILINNDGHYMKIDGKTYVNNRGL